MHVGGCDSAWLSATAGNDGTGAGRKHPVQHRMRRSLVLIFIRMLSSIHLLSLFQQSPSSIYIVSKRDLDRPSHTTMSSSADAEQQVASPIASKGPFAYPQIDPLMEIRILELSPPDLKDRAISSSKSGGAFASRLRGSFIVAKLAEKPRYEALSYAWGEPVFDEVIEFPEGVLPITSHLSSGLRHLRKKSLTRCLWVDAICINQSHDSAEKGHQVSLMASIYRKTERVLVWLGSGSLLTAGSIDLFIGWSRTCMKYNVDARAIVRGTYGIFPSEAYSECSKKAQKILRKVSCVSLSDLLPHFLGQNWFQRLWIVQEMALPPDLVLLNGTRSISIHDFTLAILVLCRHSDEASDYVNSLPVRQAQDLCLMRLAIHDQEDTYEGFDILALVEGNSERLCKEPKDRIYALLGLCDARSKKIFTITPDYNLSDADAFQQFAINHLLHGDLQCLHYAGLVRHSCKQPFVPSWVPDWTCNETRISTRIHLSSGYLSSRARRRIGSAIAFDNRDAAIVGIGGLLSDFVHVDVLAEGPDSNEGIRHQLENCGGQQEQIEAIYAWYKTCNVHYKGGSRYNNGEDIEAVLASTLVLNLPFGRTAGREFGLAMSPSTASCRMVRWLRRLTCIKQHTHPCELPTCAALPRPEAIEFFISDMERLGLGRTLFTTKNGYIGLGPASLKPGDAVVVFYGAETPFVLRKSVPDKGAGNLSGSTVDEEDCSTERWQLVGDCYLHGFMTNEILRPEFEGKDKMFWLV